MCATYFNVTECRGDRTVSLTYVNIPVGGGGRRGRRGAICASPVAALGMAAAFDLSLTASIQRRHEQRRMVGNIFLEVAISWNT